MAEAVHHHIDLYLCQRQKRGQIRETRGLIPFPTSSHIGTTMHCGNRTRQKSQSSQKASTESAWEESTQPTGLVVYNRLACAVIVQVGIHSSECHGFERTTILAASSSSLRFDWPAEVGSSRALLLLKITHAAQSQPLAVGDKAPAVNGETPRLLCQLECPKRRRRRPHSWRPVTLVEYPQVAASNTHHVRVLQRVKPSSSTVGTVDVLFLPVRTPTDFLKDVSDLSPISALCLPGTHETFARYGWPISQCQEPTATISTQLRAGIRFMDFRVSPKGLPGKERLLAFHGATDQKIELGDALQQVYDFLNGDGKTEFLLMSLKPEGGDASLMQKLLFDFYIDDMHRCQWFLEPRIPTLGEARGKVVLFSRFGSSQEQPGGICPPIWPNNYKGLFSYDLPTHGQKVTTQDWFSIGSLRYLDDKFELVKELLESGATREPYTLALNFCSASTFPLALPPAVAKGIKGPRCLAVTGINVRVRDYVAAKLAASLDEESAAAKVSAPFATAQQGLQAVFALDFFDYADAIDLVSLLIESNFSAAM